MANTAAISRLGIVFMAAAGCYQVPVFGMDIGFSFDLGQRFFGENFQQGNIAVGLVHHRMLNRSDDGDWLAAVLFYGDADLRNALCALREDTT